MFKEIADKYLGESNRPINEDEIVYDINGIVLHKTSDALFYLSGDMVDETVAYCKSNGYEIDAITFVTSYDIDLSYKNRSVTKLKNGSLIASRSSKMHSESRLIIVKEEGRLIAKIFMGSNVKIDQTHGKNS